MVYTWIISFWIALAALTFIDSPSLEASPLPRWLPPKMSREDWIRMIDRSKNGTALRYYKMMKQKRDLKKKRKADRLARKKKPVVNYVEQSPLGLERAHVKPSAPVQAVPKDLPVPSEQQLLAENEHQSVDIQIYLDHSNTTDELSNLIHLEKEEHKPLNQTEKPPSDLSTDFTLSRIEQMLKNTSCTQEMGIQKKSNSYMQPHLVNGKGVYLSIYDDRQESLAPLSPIPFLKVSSQSTFNYIEDLGVIFIPIDGTYLIKYGFSGDGMHWGEEYSSVQLTINETTIIPNSIITACQEGVMSSHSIILPLKVNDRVRLINSTATNSLTLFQPTPGGVTAYLEMILLE